MATLQTQIKINLSVKLHEYLLSRAQRFDVPAAVYIKHLILKDVDEMDYPVFRVSKRTEQKAVEALEDKKREIEVKNVQKFFKDL